MAKELANHKKDMADLKAVSMWLWKENKHLHDKATYYKEIVSVHQASSQGTSAPVVFLPNADLVPQIRGLHGAL